MLELRHITKRYSGIPVVADVSFVAYSGEVTGYLGPNGSGKSTTLKMIAGLIDPPKARSCFTAIGFNGTASPTVNAWATSPKIATLSALNRRRIS